MNNSNSNVFVFVGWNDDWIVASLVQQKGSWELLSLVPPSFLRISFSQVQQLVQEHGPQEHMVVGGLAVFLSHEMPNYQP